MQKGEGGLVRTCAAWGWIPRAIRGMSISDAGGGGGRAVRERKEGFPRTPWWLCRQRVCCWVGFVFGFLPNLACDC